MSEQSEILIYQTEDGETRIQTLLKDETVWLSQAQMAELFDKTTPTINEHIKNIFDEGELSEESTIRNFRIVQTEGKREVSRDVNFYNLDVIISVGYRVKSHRGTQFRIW
ncbi:MAG: virulence RhuM family protein, partial [Alphaproteobacteria bacterium]|nr:virulence RhuM family protein [Alphaproteobacteria bacterium]